MYMYYIFTVLIQNSHSFIVASTAVGCKCPMYSKSVVIRYNRFEPGIVDPFVLVSLFLVCSVSHYVARIRNFSVFQVVYPSCLLYPKFL